MLTIIRAVFAATCSDSICPSFCPSAFFFFMLTLRAAGQFKSSAQWQQKDQQKTTELDVNLHPKCSDRSNQYRLISTSKALAAVVNLLPTLSRAHCHHCVCDLSKLYLNDSSWAAYSSACKWCVSHACFGWQMQSVPVSADGLIYIALLFINNIILSNFHKLSWYIQIHQWCHTYGNCYKTKTSLKCCYAVDRGQT